MERYFNFMFWLKLAGLIFAGAVIIFWIVFGIVTTRRERKNRRKNY